jgi:hypothetical protein
MNICIFTELRGYLHPGKSRFADKVGLTLKLSDGRGWLKKLKLKTE